MMYVTSCDSPLGQLILTCSDQALTGLYMNREILRQEEHPLFRQTKRWLDAYFRGENPPLEIPLLPEGTSFQQQVWQLLLEIPYGKTRTYGDLAREITFQTGKRMSAQAVGQAVGRNPISILIPCHRVIGAKGRLTGYEWGLEKKTWLLRHEGRQIKNDIVL